MGLFGNKNEAVKVEEEIKVEKRLYCIDFENVSDAGLIGISKLTENDEVVIFYGSNNNSISFSSHEMIVLANAKVTIAKCDKSAKNYLDFQLTSYVGMRLGRDNFKQVIIVSKDMGFDSVVDFWTGENVNITRQAAIDSSIKIEAKPVKEKPAKKSSEKKPVKKVQENKPQEKKSQPVKKGSAPKSNDKSLPDSYRKKVRNAVKEDNLKPTQYTLIYNTILRSKTIDDYKIYIGKKLGDKADSVFEKTKDIFADYAKSV